MFGLSPGHLIILAFVVLLFGHRRLPELGFALGKGMDAFKKGLEGKNTEDHSLPPPTQNYSEETSSRKKQN